MAKKQLTDQEKAILARREYVRQYNARPEVKERRRAYMQRYWLNKYNKEGSSNA